MCQCISAGGLGWGGGYCELNVKQVCLRENPRKFIWSLVLECAHSCAILGHVNIKKVNYETLMKERVRLLCWGLNDSRAGKIDSLFWIFLFRVESMQRNQSCRASILAYGCANFW